MAKYVHTFWAWWFSELKSFVPQRLWKLCRRREEIVGVLQRSEFSLFEITGHLERLLMRISNDACEFDVEFREAISQIKRRRPRLTLRLGMDLGLRKVLKLPSAAKNDLKQLLCFQMDRLSPFAAAKVHFTYRILQLIEKERCILVEVQIVPRAVVERALATCECLGLEPERLELAGSAPDEALNLLPQHAMRRPRIKPLDRGLAVLALAFAGLVLMVPLQKQRARATDLERQVVAEAREAEKSVELREQLDILISTWRFINDRKKAAPMVTRVLAELTRLIPDDAHVVELHMNGEHIRMRGYSQSVSDMVVALESSSLFWKPEFHSAITRDLDNNREHFLVSVALRPEGGWR